MQTPHGSRNDSRELPPAKPVSGGAGRMQRRSRTCCRSSRNCIIVSKGCRMPGNMAHVTKVYKAGQQAGVYKLKGRTVIGSSALRVCAWR